MIFVGWSWSFLYLGGLGIFRGELVVLGYIFVNFGDGFFRMLLFL